MPVSIIPGSEIASYWPVQKTNSRGFNRRITSGKLMFVLT